MSKISNIAFLNNSGAGDYGGVEKWIFKISKALQEKGHQPFIIARDKSLLLQKAKQEGFNYKMISKIGSSTFVNPLRVLKLFNYLKENKIDALFFCSSPTFKFGSVAAKLAGVNNIIYRRGSAIPIKDKFYNKYLMNNYITTFISNSKATKEKSLKYLNDFENEKVELIYNGVDIDKFGDVELETNIRKEFNISNDKLVIVNVGRLHKQKGQNYLIEAVNKLKSKLNEFVVLLVGEGPMEDTLKNKVKELNLEEYIIFTGFRNDIASILKQADFMTHTALWEGCPWVVLEALAAGLPVVATDSSSLPEIISNGENGYLAQDQNANDIAQKMLKMCTKTDIKLLGKNAKKIAQDRFSFDRVVTQTEECILK